VRKKIVILTGILVIVCGCMPAGIKMTPPSSASVSPLEYRIEDQEEWTSILEDEIRLLRTDVVYIRRTEQCKACELRVNGNITMPKFSGEITEEDGDGIVKVQGTGGIIISLGLHITLNYAKIILEQ